MSSTQGDGRLEAAKGQEINGRGPSTANYEVAAEVGFDLFPEMGEWPFIWQGVVSLDECGDRLIKPWQVAVEGCCKESVEGEVFLAAGNALHVHRDDALGGEHHPIAHGLVGIDDLLIIQQQ